MDKEPSRGIRIIRSEPFPTYDPQFIRAGVVNSEPFRRVSVVFMNEDTLHHNTAEQQGEPVLFETARLNLTPGVANDLARLLVKCLDLFVRERPDEARAYGISRQGLDDLGKSSFGQ